jgi:uncharacterized membrane protein YkoI
MKKEILASLTVATLLVGCSDNQYGRNETAAKNANVASQFNDLPAPVKAAVKREVPNGIVDKVSTETKDGRLVYKVKFQDDGINPAIWVTADGNVLKSDISRDKAFGATGNAVDLTTGYSKSDLKFTQLPAAVQKTVRERAPSAKIADIKQRTRDGVLVYEVSFEEKGANPNIIVANDGTIVRDLAK